MERRAGSLEDVDLKMEKLFDGIFKGKTVLVTGHTGFKGSWLSLWLISLGADVIGYSLPPPTKPSLFLAAKLNEHITHIIGDVRDAVNVDKVIRKYKPDMIFHLAAQPLVRYSYKEPMITFETNVMGTVNILEAVRHVDNIRSCIIVTSDKCYDNKGQIYPYRENDSLGGYDPYSSSKACTELVVAGYRSSFFFNSNVKSETGLSTVRAGNVIGGGDWALDRIVPDTIQSLVKNEQVPVRNPNAIRPWQHVLEPLAGYLTLSTKLWQDSQKYSSAWNFGPDNTGNITVRELVEKIIARWGCGSWLDLSGDNKNEPHEANYLKLDCTKAGNLLNWYPVYDVSETVNVTTDWYHQYHLVNSTDILLFTLRQIDAYVEKGRRIGAVWTKQNGG